MENQQLKSYIEQWQLENQGRRSSAQSLFLENRLGNHKKEDSKEVQAGGTGSLGPPTALQ